MIKLLATHSANPEKYIPKYQTEGAACADLIACIPPNIVDGVDIGNTIKLGFRSIVMIGCGIGVKIPDGYKLCIAPRSGLSKQGIFILNSPGQLDADFTGEIKVIVANFSHNFININDGDRFAQCWIEPVYKADWAIVEELPETVRNTQGFGSTGV